MHEDRFSDLDWNEEPIATQRAELRLRLAGAKNDVAAQLVWYIAFWTAAAAYLKWDSWPITLLAAVGTYFLFTHGFRQDLRRAKDEYIAHTHQEPDFM